ncbi:sulfite exporter TauE/SafE family protein [Motiliproteus sp. MSK22-1]|uniref:sulfite exporter TauE/SafE family protein n=1 Tax=Motiliproteus sp. MSK22-1 TaxID=1897630 RepID=UPI000977C443|nr:sulfite exporter TauE/SafE family protein [Motiliproteus sp. MSK22-1]OMH36573.1 hypothetical protein BGP75_09485 [Motiliproteus sp. MSK22-1]
MIAGLELSVLMLSAVALFAAAFVRGYSGFGFTAMAVVTLSIIIPPSTIVPVILLIEIVAGMSLLPSVWQRVDWRQLRWILFGAVLATPVGVMMLSELSGQVMRVVISSVILMAACAIWLGFRARKGESATSIVSAGVVSGAMNGASGVGGLPLVVFFLSRDENPGTARATLICFLIVLDIYTCSLATLEGLITSEVLQLAVLFLIPVTLGTMLGNQQFLRSPQKSFRRVALVMLMLISGGGLTRALISL